jgi:hypothetical protein
MNTLETLNEYLNISHYGLSAAITLQLLTN